MTPLVEKWRPIPGYEGRYEVSDSGRVRSQDWWLVARSGAVYFRSGKIRALSRSTQTGYLKVTLNNAGERRTWNVQQLVAIAFLGPRPPGLDICHTNGDPTDNRATNLRYDTESANIQDAIRHGTHWPSRKTHCVNGHEFTPENTLPRKTNSGAIGRRCATCDRARIR